MGTVALVGAGPGDPDLLTVKALRTLQSAEVVLHDKLVSPEVLALIPADAERVNVGKRCGDVKDRGLQQDEIHELLVERCRRGKRVVRLKCGDPLVFGRGGEELEFMAEHGIRAEVVPGITSALGAAASCQLPLTHRGCGANQVRFVVGQDKAKRLPDLCWEELAREAGTQTVVFYMGMRSLAAICTRLVEHGAEASTPMALIESATSADERSLYGTVGTLPGLASESNAGKTGPVLLVLGPVAAFPARLRELAGERPAKRARMAEPTEPSQC